METTDMYILHYGNKFIRRSVELAPLKVLAQNDHASEPALHWSEIQGLHMMIAAPEGRYGHVLARITCDDSQPVVKKADAPGVPLQRLQSIVYDYIKDCHRKGRLKVATNDVGQYLISQRYSSGSASGTLSSLKKLGLIEREGRKGQYLFWVSQ